MVHDTTVYIQFNIHLNKGDSDKLRVMESS